MTPPSDRPIPRASFDTPEMIAARTTILNVQNARRREFLVREFSAEGIQLIIRLQARLTDAWTTYDNLLYDAGRASEPSADTDKHTVSILVDRAFIGELDAWSQPVQVRIEQNERGHQLMSRAYTPSAASDSAVTEDAEHFARYFEQRNDGGMFPLTVAGAREVAKLLRAQLAAQRDARRYRTLCSMLMSSKQHVFIGHLHSLFHLTLSGDLDQAALDAWMDRSAPTALEATDDPAR